MSRSFSTSGTTEVILPGLGPQTVNNGRQQTPHWGNMLSVQATQVIYSGGALTAGIKIAEAGERIAELDVRKSRQEVRFLLTGIYLDQVRLMNQLEVIDVHIALTEQVLEQMRAKERAGVVHADDPPPTGEPSDPARHRCRRAGVRAAGECDLRSGMAVLDGGS